MQRTTNALITLPNLHIARFVFNTLQENTYLLFRPQHPETIIIDCGAQRESDYETLSSFITQHHLRPTHHLITHAHFDHLLGAQWLYNTYGILPAISPLELHNYHSAQQSMQQVLHTTKLLPLPPQPLLTFPEDTLPIQFLHTPGHSPGSTSFYLPQHKILFCGDLYFKGYLGITRGNEHLRPAILQTLRNTIYTLPHDTTVFPGHGPEFLIKDNIL